MVCTLNIKTEVLGDALSYVQSAISSFNVDDMYTYIRFKIDNERISLNAGNSVYSKRIQILQSEEEYELELDDPVDIAIPGSTLIKLIKSSKNKKTTLTIDDFSVSFKSGGVKAVLAGVEGFNYPSVMFDEEGKWISIPHYELEYLYQMTSPLVSKSLTRPILTGLHHRFSEDKLDVTGADGSAVGHSAINLLSQMDGSEDVSVTIPSEVAKEVVRLKVEDSNDPINIRFSERAVLYNIGNRDIYGLLLEGDYPVQAITVLHNSLERDTGTTFNIKQESLSRIVNIAELYSTVPTVEIVFEPKTGSLRIVHDQTNENVKMAGGFKYDKQVETSDTKDEIFQVFISTNILKRVLSCYEKGDLLKIGISGLRDPILVQQSWEIDSVGHTFAPIIRANGKEPDLDNFSPEISEEDEEMEEVVGELEPAPAEEIEEATEEVVSSEEEAPEGVPETV